MIIKEDLFGDLWIEIINGDYHVCRNKIVSSYDKDGNLIKKEVLSTSAKRSLHEAVMDIATVQMHKIDKPVLNLMDLISHLNKFKSLL